MNLFLLRHALAVEREEFDFATDEARPLVAKGRRQLRATAAVLRDLKIQFDAIWSSPLVRTRQTAEIIAGEMKNKKAVVLVEELRPGGSSKKLVQKISAQKKLPENLLLVGHEPDLSDVLSLLVTGKSGAGFALKKGALAKLEIETFRAGQCATLAWLLPPKLGRR